MRECRATVRRGETGRPRPIMRIPSPWPRANAYNRPCCGARFTPEDGGACYAHDPTQGPGPACAMAAGAADAVRTGGTSPVVWGGATIPDPVSSGCLTRGRLRRSMTTAHRCERSGWRSGGHRGCADDQDHRPASRAVRMKTSRSHVARIEGGRVRPSTAVFERLAKATGTSPRSIGRSVRWLSGPGASPASSSGTHAPAPCVFDVLDVFANDVAPGGIRRNQARTCVGTVGAAAALSATFTSPWKIDESIRWTCPRWCRSAACPRTSTAA